MQQKNRYYDIIKNINIKKLEVFGFKALVMNKKFSMKTGIALIVIASLGFGVVGCNKSDKLPDNAIESEVKDNELEDTYLDDNYEMSEDVDLNEEFENRVESEKNNQSNNSNDSHKDDNSNTSNNTENSSEEKEENNTNTNNSNDNQANVNKKTGVFQGFADDNFVEMKIGNEYATYRVSSEAKSVLSNKDLGDSVTFEFTKENGQLFITSVK